MDLHLKLPHEILGLVISLAIGLLIGLERGWRERTLPEGGRAAGFRTFTLIGLLGGILGSMPESLRSWALSIGLLILGAFMTVAYWRGSLAGNQSITTAVALLLTYALGAYAVLEDPLVALGLAVIVALLLSLKQTLHGWLHKIRQEELVAGIQLLVLSLVILPSLPDRGIGPYLAINPYQLWWAVILIAALSMAGHIAVRAFGLHRGILWTGLLGGLASSTAATMALASKAQQNPHIVRPAGAGVLSATAMMCVRLLVVLWVLEKTLFVLLLPTLLVSALVLITPFIWQILHMPTAPVTEAQNESLPGMVPYSLRTALGFGLFLAVISVTVPTAREWFGREGVYVIATLSGLADVDAITISLAMLFKTNELPISIASTAIFIAILTNLVVKAGMVIAAGNKHLGCVVITGYLAAAVSGLLTWLLTSH